MSITDRNDILHSVAGGSTNDIWFNRRKTDVVFSSKIVRYDTAKLLNIALKCSQLSSDIMSDLGITKADYVSFFQQAHNKANQV